MRKPVTILQSLYSRFLLIIITPTLLLSIAAYYAFFERHWDNISETLAKSITKEVYIVANAPTSSMREGLARSLGFNFAEHTKQYFESLEFKEEGLAKGPEIELLHQELKASGLKVAAIIQHDSKQDLEVYTQTGERLLHLTIPRKRLISPTTRIFVGWIFSVATCLIVLALCFLRSQIRSISKLAEAAEEFGRGQSVREFKLSGAREVRQVGQAFFRMKRRLERQMQQRTELLAGVSHDLRTPLTRMRLILASASDTESAGEMRREISEMEELISEYLAFARGEVREPYQQVDVAELLRSLLSNLPYSQQIVFRQDLASVTQLKLRPRAINRAMTNIIDNAARISKAIEVTISDKISDSQIAIIIDDDGPGVAPGEARRIFEPFVSLAIGGKNHSVGTGLGLTIAKDIINNHGGEIEVGASPLGGARFTVLLVK